MRSLGRLSHGLFAAAAVMMLQGKIELAAAREVIHGERGTIQKAAEVKLGNLSSQPVNQPAKPPKPQRLQLRPQRKALQVPKDKGSKAAPSSLNLTTSASGTLKAQAALPTPPTTASFPALPDNGVVDVPNTQGAVGPNHLMVATDSEIRYQDRNGGVLQTVSTDGFWSRAGATNVYDVRLLYDPYGGRWLMSGWAQPDPNQDFYLLLLAVSATTDPTGNWYLYTNDVSAGGSQFPDMPNLGFNKNWIGVQTDLFDMSEQPQLVGSAIYAFNRTNIYSGRTTGQFWSTMLSPDTDGATHVPAITYDPDIENLYFMSVWWSNDGNGYGWLGIHELRGPVGSEQLFGPDGNTLAYLTWSYPWSDYPDGHDAFFPQLGTTNKIQACDSRLNNVVYRNGTLWTTHTIYLPATNPTRASVQFWEVLPRGGGNGPVQNYRLDDPSNVTCYGFPSVGVNQSLEVLLGYTRFSRNEYPSAAYSYRSGVDAFSTFRPVQLLKNGETPYLRTNWQGELRWGRYSATVPDPVNDTDLWTIQEYATTNGALGSGWGTWWGRVTPPVDLSLSITAIPDPVLAGGTLTYLVTVTNNYFGHVDDVVVTNTLPDGIPFISASGSQGNWMLTNGQIAWSVGALEDRAAATLTVVLAPQTVGQVTNTGTASARGPEATPANNTATLVTSVQASADLALTCEGSPELVTAGEPLTYFLTVTNRGPWPAAGVYVTNVFPYNAWYITNSASYGQVTRTSNTVVWSIQGLTNNMAQTLSIVVTLPAGTATNRAVVRSTTADPNLGNNLTTNVTRVNARPTIQALGNRTNNEDTATGTISFTVGDRETAASNLVVTVFSSNEQLIPTANIPLGGSGSNRTINLIPLANQFGIATITLIVADADGATATNSFLWNVLSVNDPPTLDSLPDRILDEDAGPQVVTLSGISGGPANESQTVTITASSSAPSIIPNPIIDVPIGTTSTRLLTFTPATNAFGTVTITVTANDGASANNIITRTFTVSINPANDPPTLNPIADMNLNEDAPQQTVTLTGISPGPANEGQTVTVTITNFNPELLTNVVLTYANGTTGTLTFRTVTNAFGVATLQVTVNDGGLSNNVVSQTFRVTINAVNDPPVISTITAQSINEDTLLTVPFGLTDVDSPLSNILLTATASNAVLVPPQNMTFSQNGANCLLTLLPATNQFGTTTITVTANDQGASNNLATQKFSLTINPVNDPPTLDPMAPIIIDEDVGLQQIPLTGISAGPANEPQTNFTIAVSSSNPGIISNPTIAYTNGSSTAVLKFTPAPNAFGDLTLTITLNDGGTTNNLLTQTVPVTVRAVNDPPTLNAINPVTVNEDAGQVTVNLGGITTGATNEMQTLVVSATCPNLDLLTNLQVNYTSPQSTGTVSFGTVSNAFGTANVTVTLSDGVDQISRTFTVTISPVNDPPTLDPITDVLLQEDFGTYTVPLTGISAGPPNEPQTNIAITVTSDNISVVPAPQVIYTKPASIGSLRFTSITNAFGTSLITVRVTDGGTTNHATTNAFRVTVNSVNDLPSISPIASLETPEDTPVVIPFTIGDVETPAANLELRAISATEEVVTSDAISFGGTGSNRTVRIVPLPNQYGMTTIQITVTDSDSESSSVEFDLNVTPVNDLPVITPIPDVVSNEGEVRTVNFAVWDVETLASDIVVTLSSSNPALVSANGLELTRNDTNCTLNITPKSGQGGSTTITVTADDLSGGVSTRSFNLKVNAYPTIAAIADQITDEDVPIEVAVHVGDLETPATNLLVTAAASNPALLSSNSFTFIGTGADRLLRIQPLTNEYGSAVVTVTVQDGDSATRSTNFNLTVNPVNDPPVIAPLTPQTTLMNTLVTVNFTVSDAENSSQDLLVTGSSGNPALVQNNDLVFGGSGANRTVSITPVADQMGTANITLIVVDKDGAIGQGTFVLTVTGGDSTPTISTLPNLSINEDTVAGPLTFTVGDLDTPASNLVVTASSSNQGLIEPTNIVLSGAGSERTATITPNTNEVGNSTITLVVSDGTHTNSTSFVLTVLQVNDPPTLNFISDLVIVQDSGLQAVPLSGISAGPTNEAGQTLRLMAFSSNTGIIPNPTVNYSSPNSTGTLTFTPVLHAPGTAQITVQVDDGQSTNTQKFLVTVTPVNVAPTITLGVPSTLSTNEDMQAVIPFTVFDFDTPALGLTITATSTNTALMPNANLVVEGTGSNRVLYALPATNQFGTTLITLSVSDGLASGTATCLLTVNSVNDPPTVDPKPPLFLGYNPGSVKINVTGISSGASNESQTLTLTVSNSNASYFLTAPSVSYTNPNSTAVISFQPKQNNSGVGSNIITLTVRDNGTSNNVIKQPFLVYTRPNNSITPPIVSGISNQTILENTNTAPLAFTVRSTTYTPSQLMVAGYSSNPRLLPVTNIVFSGTSTNRTVTCTPARNQTGTSTVTVSVSDANYGGTNVSFLLTVNPVNTPPIIAGLTDMTVNEDTSTGLISFTVSDAETPAAAVGITAFSSNTNLVPSANIIIGGNGTTRALTILPATNQNGTATIALVANDGSNSASNTFVLTVTAVNDAPVLSLLPPQHTWAGIATGPIPFTVTDIDTPLIDLLLSANSSNPSLVPDANIVLAGSGSNRTVNVTPLTAVSGTVTITINVSDGAATNDQAFSLTIDPVNAPPTLAQPADAKIDRANGNSMVVVNLTGIGSGGEAQALSVTASSSNPGLVPNPIVNYTSPNTTATLTLRALGMMNGTAVITVTVNDGQAPNNITTRSFTVAVNGVPTISNIPVQSMFQGGSTNVAFTVCDAETPAANLIVTASSRNPTLVPNANLTVTGSGSNRTVLVTPASGQTGSGMIDLVVRDADGAASTNSFLLMVIWANQAPTLDALSDMTLPPGAGPQGVALTGISAGPNENQSLTITATSSDTGSIPTPSIDYISPNSTGTLRFTPAAGAAGTVTITVIVKDDGGIANGGQETLIRSFTVRFSSGPSISSVAEQNIFENGSTNVAVTIGDPVTPAASLVVTAKSHNVTLIPDAGLVWHGSNSNRTLQITPAGMQIGTGVVELVVRNASGVTATNTLSVNVLWVNQAPTLNALSDMTLGISAAEQRVSLAGISAGPNETQALTILANSSNPELIPNPSVDYTSPGSTGTLRFTPVAGASGSASIEVTVRDDGDSANGGQNSFTRSFAVTVTAVTNTPALQIRRNAGDLLVTWPCSASNCVLQARGDFAGGAWDRVRATPVQQGDEYQVTISGAGPMQFFRLAPPGTEGPVLHIRPNGDMLVIYWSSSLTNCVLQARDDFAGADWANVGNRPVEVGGDYEVTVAATGPRRFYRLAPGVYGPALQITRGNGVVIVSWLADAGSYDLQMRDSFDTGTWGPAGTPVLNNGRYERTVSTTGNAKFFRLAPH